MRRCCLGLGDVEWQNASDFSQSFAFSVFHAVILRRHERQRGSTLAAQFDLTSSGIKDCACKEESKGTFFLFCGRPNFSCYVAKEYNLAGATLANPKGKASNCSSNPKNRKMHFWPSTKVLCLVKIYDLSVGKSMKQAQHRDRKESKLNLHTTGL